MDFWRLLSGVGAVFGTTLVTPEIPARRVRKEKVVGKGRGFGVFEDSYLHIRYTI
jgi:hypothetical protein